MTRKNPISVHTEQKLTVRGGIAIITLVISLTFLPLEISFPNFDGLTVSIYFSYTFHEGATKHIQHQKYALYTSFKA